MSDSVERRASTVGRVDPHLESKIIGPDGRVVPRGERGEICTRGYSVMLGYWDEPEQTASVKDADGWMHTGDLRVMDTDGYCNIVGRIKDMVIRGGENLYPREIEDFLRGHSAVRDVAVFGVPDDNFGEELCAWIILRDGGGTDEAAIRQFCMNQIARQKIPRYIRFVAAVPMTVTGKVQKCRMRAQMETELGVIARVTAWPVAGTWRGRLPGASGVKIDSFELSEPSDYPKPRATARGQDGKQSERRTRNKARRHRARSRSRRAVAQLSRASHHASAQSRK